MSDLDDLAMPVFVYGTLRPKMGNSHLWRETGATAFHDGEVWVYGWEMRGNTIPYAYRTLDEEDGIVGCLIFPPSELEMQVRMRWALDALEGHPNAYVRVKVRAWIPELRRTMWVWMYDGSDIARGPRIASGDYYEHKQHSYGMR